MTLGVVPLGTGNDFASALGFPDDPGEALEALVTGAPRAVDLGRVNDRLFVNVSAGGFIADVSEAIDPALKSVAGRLAFLIGGAKVLLSAQPFTCTMDDRARECLMFAVCNAPTIGGGRPIAPHADPSDGQLDVCLVSAMELVDFLAMLGRVAAGSHLDDPRVEYFRTSRLTLRFDREINVNVDGEPFAATPATTKCCPARCGSWRQGSEAEAPRCRLGRRLTQKALQSVVMHPATMLFPSKSATCNPAMPTPRGPHHRRLVGHRRGARARVRAARRRPRAAGAA
jgi:YegS/Rv2252/BmrU family lipid kinase